MSWWNPSTNALRTSRGQASGIARAEPLEGRRLFSLIIAPLPQYGLEGTQLDTSNNNSQPAHPALYIIFWGSYWGGVNSAPAKEFETAAARLLQTPFLGDTVQYGTDGKATLGDGKVSFAYDDATEPQNGDFGPSEIYAVAASQYGSKGPLPSPQSSVGTTPVYLVVTPPEIESADTGANGFNAHIGSGKNTEYVLWTDSHSLSSTSATGAQLNVNRFTDILSHELTESDTHTYDLIPNSFPTTDGINLTHICDGEAQLFKFFEPNGVLVQSDWSTADNAFAVDNGTSLDFNLVPTVSPSNAVTYALTVSGTQTDAPANSTFSVTSTASGGVSVSLDGQTSTFARGQISSINLQTETSKSLIDVKNVPQNVPLTINCAGADEIEIGDNRTAVGVKGAVTIAGTTSQTVIHVDDRAHRGGSTIQLSSTEIDGIAPAPIVFQAAQTRSITLEAGKGSNVLDVASLPSAAPIDFVGGPNSNTVSGPNGAGGDNNWHITGRNRGTLASLAFRKVKTLVGVAGQSATEVFSFYPHGRLSGQIRTDGGNEWLDYSRLNSHVKVDLASGAASFTGGISGIHNVLGANGTSQLIGDAQPDILVGGTGNDRIHGGGGRSLLIGDGGSDTMLGGTNGDIIIGGYTDFDGNTAALVAILAEWNSNDSYATRVADLSNGGGLNGTSDLVFSATVHEDGARNQLTGGSGQDWFFKDLHDTVSKADPSETVS